MNIYKFLYDYCDDDFSFFYSNNIDEKFKDEINELIVSLKKYLNSGSHGDAFTVYYAFSEAFNIFGKGYKSVSSFLSELVETERHSGPMVTSQRDHFGHSVYVFAIGLIIFKNDESIQRDFENKYNINHYEFLKMWGTTALFHDLGYPFQLVHDQMRNYIENSFSDFMYNEKLSITFNYYDEFIRLNEIEKNNISKITGIKADNINDFLTDILITKHKTFKKEKISTYLKERVLNQSVYIDHGYFGSLVLARLIANSAESLTGNAVDILYAVLVHNDIFKFDDLKNNTVDQIENPLAALLIMCDDLQAWDRIPFGKVSKQKPIAWEAQFDISKNNIKIEYLFDSELLPNGRDFNKNVLEVESGKMKQDILKRFSNFHSNLSITYRVLKKDKLVEKYMSYIKLDDLLDFAKKANESYNNANKNNALPFEERELKYRISNIEAIKDYPKKLDFINCFVSDEEFDYPVLDKVDSKIEEFLYREEHARWAKNARLSGIKYGNSYIIESNGDNKKMKELKELRKENINMVPYEMLSEESKLYDKQMIKTMFNVLTKNQTNYKVYKYSSGKKYKTNLAFITSDEKLTKDAYDEIKNYLNNLNHQTKVVVWTTFMTDTDLDICEIALNLNITIKAVLPYDYDTTISFLKRKYKANNMYFDEIRWRQIIACTCVCHMNESINRLVLKANKIISLDNKNKIRIVNDDVIIGKTIIRKTNNDYGTINYNDIIIIG